MFVLLALSDEISDGRSGKSSSFIRSVELALQRRFALLRRFKDYEPAKCLVLPLFWGLETS